MQTLNQMPSQAAIAFQVKSSAKAHCIHLSIQFKNAVAPFTATVPDMYLTEAWMFFKWLKRMARKGPTAKKKFYTEEFRLAGGLLRFVLETRVHKQYTLKVFTTAPVKPSSTKTKEYKQEYSLTGTHIVNMAMALKGVLPPEVNTALQIMDLSEPEIKRIVNKQQPDTMRFAAGPKIKREVAQHILNQQAGNEITFTITHALAGDAYNYNSDSFWAPFVNQWLVKNKNTKQQLPNTEGFEQALKQHFHIGLQEMLEMHFNNIKGMNERMISPTQHADRYIELQETDALYKQQCLVLEKLAFIQFMPVTITNNPYRLHVAVHPIELFKELFDSNFKRMVKYTRELTAKAFAQAIGLYCKINITEVGLKFEHRLGEGFK